MHMDWNGWGMGGGWLFMVLFWGVAIALIAAVMITVARKTGERGTGNGSALEVLKKRYAKGEITRDEYERMKKDIGSA